MSRAATYACASARRPLHRQRILVDDTRQRGNGFVCLTGARVEPAQRVLKVQIREAGGILGHALEVSDSLLDELRAGGLCRLTAAGILRPCGVQHAEHAMRLGVVVVKLERFFGDALRIVCGIATEEERCELCAHLCGSRIGSDPFFKCRLRTLRIPLRLEMTRDQELVVRLR
jgi:hypothetical protein